MFWVLMGAAIFPETSKYGGGPEKMAIVAVRQRWRRCLGRWRQLGLGNLQAAKTVANVGLSCSLCSATGPCKASESLICVKL